MRVENVARALAEAGFTAEEVAGRVVLCERVWAAFERHAGRPPRWGWFVPGRLEVLGKHTDYAGGRSLVAAVPRGFVVAAHPRDDGVVSVVDARWRDAVDIDPGDRERAFKGWTNYAAVVARRFALNFPGAPLGTDIVISSDLPRAAGVSSSSALVVGLALALARRAGLRMRPEWQAAIRTSFDLGGYLGAVENGLAFPSLPGAGGVGTHGGSQDHNAILNGRAERVSAFGYVPVRHLADAVVPADWAFIVMSSGVRADKAGSVRGRYNRASLGTRALVELWRTTGEAGDAQTLGEVVSDPARVAALTALATGGHGDFGGDELVARLRHFVAETGRVDDAIAAFRGADAGALAALAAASQRDADQWLGNQVEETRRLAALALEHGAFASSSFGAGFGGSVWALAQREAAGDVASRWREAYLGGGAGEGDVESFVTRPSPGALELFEAPEHVE